jgi:hypothetical protein
MISKILSIYKEVYNMSKRPMLGCRLIQLYISILLWDVASIKFISAKMKQQNMSIVTHSNRERTQKPKSLILSSSPKNASSFQEKINKKNPAPNTIISDHVIRIQKLYPLTFDQKYFALDNAKQPC